MKDLRRMTIAMKEDGTKWDYELHHTIFVGTTGAGKNSGPWAILRRCVPHILDGTMLPWDVISPVDRQLKLFRFTKLFDKFAGSSVEEQVAVVSAVYSELLERQKKIDELGRLAPSDYRALREAGGVPTFPIKVLLWDELSTTYPTIQDIPLVGEFEPVLDKRGRLVPPTVKDAINIIKSQGRQYSVFFIAVAQEFIEEKIGTKANFQYIVMLRIPSSKAQWVVSAFGSDAYDEFSATGTGPHNIPNLPNSGSAGLAYVYDTEEERVLKVRFPYTGNEAVEKLREETFDYEKAGHAPRGTGFVPNPEPLMLTKTSGMPSRPTMTTATPEPIEDPFQALPVDSEVAEVRYETVAARAVE